MTGFKRKALETNSEKFKVNANVIQSAWPGVKLPQQKFDLVFLDPPFKSGLIDVVWNELISQHLLAENCWVYLEHGIDEEPIIPKGFARHRSKQTKQVAYSLYKSD